MASITFKDVGQGDSIILEWLDKGENQIGIIDCNKKGNKNPVLDFVIANKFEKIQFIILSHPHEDHYSGLGELLEHCLEKNICIDWFGHTSFNLGKAYWKVFETNHNAIQELEKIIQLIDKLYKSGLLAEIEHLTDRWHTNLTPNLSINVLAPAYDEERSYNSKVKLDPGENKREASQAANLLSTVISISEGGNIKALVTSDAVADTFDRLSKKKLPAGTSINVIQIPHHGSRKNHSDVFWNGLHIQSDYNAVVSSGYNMKYQHPHLDVLTKIDKLGYSIHATNIIHGMRDFVDWRRTTIALDMVSELLDTKSGDKTFSL